MIPQVGFEFTEFILLCESLLYLCLLFGFFILKSPLGKRSSAFANLGVVSYFSTSFIGCPVAALGNLIFNKVEMVGAISVMG